MKRKNNSLARLTKIGNDSNEWNQRRTVSIQTGKYEFKFIFLVIDNIGLLGEWRTGTDKWFQYNWQYNIKTKSVRPLYITLNSLGKIIRIYLQLWQEHKKKLTINSTKDLKASYNKITKQWWKKLNM